MRGAWRSAIRSERRRRLGAPSGARGGATAASIVTAHALVCQPRTRRPDRARVLIPERVSLARPFSLEFATFPA
jgi:hypothetical protein